jgi:polyisoprenoid-binding protein YceI
MKTKIIIIALAFTSMVFSLPAQEYKVNTKASKLEWTGKKVAGEHWGYIQLKEGYFTVKGDKLTGGKFVIDMTSIENKDLESKEWNDKLVNHLKSEDFFHTEIHPEAVLVIKEGTPFKNNKATLKGELTVKGITHPITFVTVKKGDAYTAEMKVDRTKYNVRYGSGKFFDNLGDNMIYDDFIMVVKIIPEKNM